MEEHNTNEKPSISPSSASTETSDHGRDPPPPAAAQGGDAPEEEYPRKTREPKKRKSCASAPHKLEVLVKKKKNSAINSNFSFTFDTKICGGSGFVNAPESTPKFGSFNLVASTVIKRKEKAGEEEPNDGGVELEPTKGIIESVERKREKEKPENNDFMYCN